MNKSSPGGNLVGCMTLFGLACAAAVILGVLATLFHVGAVGWAKRNLWYEAEKARIAKDIREYDGKCAVEAQP